MLKKKVMDDLDALLADLQSTTTHISSYQQSGGGHRSPSPDLSRAPAAASTPIHSLYAQVRPTQHSSTTVVVNNINGRTSQSSSRESTPPPVPPHPPKEAIEHLEHANEESLYEVQIVKQQQVVQKQFNNTSGTHRAQVTAVVGQQYLSTDGAPQPHQGIPVTPGMSLPQPHGPPPMQSGPKSPPPVAPKPASTSSLSANLSELDILLQDLSSAQFLEEVDRKNAVNQPGSQSQPGTMNPGRPIAERSVDSLLLELEKTMSPQRSPPWAHGSPQRSPVWVHGSPHHSPMRTQGTPSNGYGYGYGQPESLYEQIRAPPPPRSAPSTLSSGMSPASKAAAASTATRELDELMNSLSEFRVTGTSPPGEPAYAQPHKQKLSPILPYPPQPSHDVTDTVAGSAAMHHSTSQGMPVAQRAASTPTQPTDIPLEDMLGNLNSDMTRQGIMTIPKGHCAACMKPIVGQVITALGKIWHPEHFSCAKCKHELGTQNFYEREGLPYCEPDYHHLFSPKCASCQGPILDKCVTALDQTWHPEHFVCYTCHRPFGEEGFHEKDGKAFCREDYFENFSPKCGGCGRAIMDNYISALNCQWHPECFVCMECLTPFGTGSFYDHEGLPYCETHYHARRGSLCAGCHKPITGRCITAMYKKFHPEHFVCAFCLKQLNKGTFKEQNDKPYCHPCFIKLFG